MASLTNYSSLYDTADNSTPTPTVEHSTSSLEVAIQKYDDKMRSLIEVLTETRRRFDASVRLDRTLERQCRATLSFLKDHLRACLHSTNSDTYPLYPGESDSILEEINGQKIWLRKIRDRIRQKELEFAQFSAANWKAVSIQQIRRDRTMLVLSVQQFELP